MEPIDRKQPKDTSPFIKSQRIKRNIHIQEINTPPSSLFDTHVNYPSDELPEWFAPLQPIVEDETFTSLSINLGTRVQYLVTWNWEETERNRDVLASVLATAREKVEKEIPWHTAEGARLYEYHKSSKRWYVEVDMVHVDDETAKILLLCRVWRDETTGELKAIRVHIE